MRSAARSWPVAPTAILNLRGRNENSGCRVTCWRTSSAQMRGSSISSGATPAHWSVVMLRTQLPLVCMPCMPTLARVRHRVRQFFELDPVVLNVLPRREMAVAAIVTARHVREHPHLFGRQRAVGNRGAQHVGVKLKIHAVHQPQRLEFVLGQFARKPSRNLIAKFCDTLGDQRPIIVVIDIHGALIIPNARAVKGARDLFRGRRCWRPRWPANRWSDRSAGYAHADFPAALRRRASA